MYIPRKLVELLCSDYISDDKYRCGRSQSHLGICLSKGYAKLSGPAEDLPEHMVYDHRWTTKSFNNAMFTEEFIAEIRNRIEETGFVGMSLDIGNMEHAFTLIRIETGIVLVDSYYEKRILQISEVDVLSGLEELNHPGGHQVVEAWNSIFMVSDTYSNEECYDKIHFTYEYLEDGCSGSYFEDGVWKWEMKRGEDQLNEEFSLYKYLKSI